MAHTRTLPPGVTSQALDNFFDHVESIFGRDKVSRDFTTGALEGLFGEHSYIDPFPIGQVRTPSGAVRPSTPEEVQTVVRAANQFKIPLWTISRGKNLGYGGSAPIVDGSVILDLHLMNKILEINEEYAYAILEPGVSFLDLYEAIQDRGLNLWMSAPGIGWGSILGNCMDRGYGHGPTGEHCRNQSGLEVVLPNGDLLRTGMGAMSGSPLFALHKEGYGPSIDGLFFQSNLGVVTKIGIHLYPAPEAYMSCSVSVARVEDLIILTDTLSNLRRRQIIGNSPSIGDLSRQCLSSGDPSILNRIGPYVAECRTIPNELLEEIRVEKGWGNWFAFFSLYGTIEVVPALFESVKRAFSAVAGSTVTSESWPGVPGQYLKASIYGERAMPDTGVPSMLNLKRLFMDEKVKRGHVAFSPILPPSGREVYKYYLDTKKILDNSDVHYHCDFHITERYVYSISLLNFRPAQKERTREIFGKLLEVGTKHGLTEYRTHTDFMEELVEHFDFNNKALHRYTTLLKDTMDPNGILSPGKSGIWTSKGDFKKAVTKI